MAANDINTLLAHTVQPYIIIILDCVLFFPNFLVHVLFYYLLFVLFNQCFLICIENRGKKTKLTNWHFDFFGFYSCYLMIQRLFFFLFQYNAILQVKPVTIEKKMLQTFLSKYYSTLGIEYCV